MASQVVDAEPHTLRRVVYLQKRLSGVVSGIATAAEVRPQADVTEEDLAAVAARAGFSFAVPLRSQPLPPPAAASDIGPGATDVHMAGGDDAGDGDDVGDDWGVGVADGADDDDSDSGSDIEDLDAMLAAEEAAAAGGHGKPGVRGGVGGWQ